MIGMYVLIVLIALFFASWIVKIAYRNTAIELSEDYLQLLTREVVDNMETSLRYGKDLSNYYGIEGELSEITSCNESAIGTVVTGTDGDVYATCFPPERAYSMMNSFYKYIDKEGVSAFAKLGENGEKISLDRFRGIVYVIRKDNTAQGYIWVIYDAEGIAAVKDVSLIKFSSDYASMVEGNALNTQTYIQNKVDNLMEKGLPASRLADLEDYFAAVASENKAVSGFTISDDGKVTVEKNDAFIRSECTAFLMHIIAILVICIIAGYELTNLIPAIMDKLPSAGKKGAETGRGKSMTGTIRILSFLLYTAIYISMPYSTVIMRKQGLSVFGLPLSLSASLPLTMELIMIFVVSLVIQRIYSKENIHVLFCLAVGILVAGNAASTKVDSAYLLILLRAFCGIGFAFLKYFFNRLVAAGSEDDEQVRENLANQNAGLLGGITVGSSLGSILAGVFGYLGNYMFTGIVIAVVFAVSHLVFNWKKLGEKKVEETKEANEDRDHLSLGSVLKDRSLFWAIILTDIPLNVGLMYVVAFLPVYMGAIGQPPILTSYAYLVNGLAGVYLGVWLIKHLKIKKARRAVALSIFTGAVGFLVLLFGKNAFVVLASAIILGIFDGYGTPTMTGYFASLGKNKVKDSAGLLTIYGSIGSAVQIICPSIYGILASPTGDTMPIAVFSIIFASFGVVLVLFGSLFIKEQ